MKKYSILLLLVMSLTACTSKDNITSTNTHNVSKVDNTHMEVKSVNYPITDSSISNVPNTITSIESSPNTDSTTIQSDL